MTSADNWSYEISITVNKWLPQEHTSSTSPSCSSLSCILLIVIKIIILCFPTLSELLFYTQNHKSLLRLAFKTYNVWNLIKVKILDTSLQFDNIDCWWHGYSIRPTHLIDKNLHTIMIRKILLPAELNGRKISTGHLQVIGTSQIVIILNIQLKR